MSIVKVAELAGVSSSTVSRVINDHPRVAPETAQAVRQAMASLSYVPSDRRPGPKPLKRERVQNCTIKLLALGGIRGTDTPGFSELLSSTARAASGVGFRFSFSHVPDAETLAAELRDEAVDGLLLHGKVPDSASRDRLMRYPTVWLMGNRPRPDWGDQVMPDGYAIGELAAQHLKDQGHEHVAFLNLDDNFWALRTYGHAFVRTAETLGVQVTDLSYKREQTHGYWQTHQSAAIERLVDDLLALQPRPTGAFVADDMQVAQIQPALQRRGIRIGGRNSGEIDLISCNNEVPYLASLSPRPRSIDIRLAAIGRRAVEQLQWRVQHRTVEERFRISVSPRLTDPEEQS